MTASGRVALVSAVDADTFGAKAASLARALRAGLPVPDGLVLAPGVVQSLVDSGSDAVLAGVLARASGWGRMLAVRSSAIGEDGAAASFAGQHVTRLGVRATEGALRAAITAVAGSANSAHAAAYRRTMAAGGSPAALRAPSMPVLVQPMVDAAASGVMFTRDPVTGADEILVEAVYGLGEAAVGGQVTPELWRMRRDGVVTHRRRGRQAAAIAVSSAGGTEERPLDPSQVAGCCLEPAGLHELARLAAHCRRVFGIDALDIEWALSTGGVTALLQCRPITTICG